MMMTEKLYVKRITFRQHNFWYGAFNKRILRSVYNYHLATYQLIMIKISLYIMHLPPFAPLRRYDIFLSFYEISAVHNGYAHQN